MSEASVTGASGPSAPASSTGASDGYVKRLTGEILRGDDNGVALVVNKPTDPLDALIEIVSAEFGGEWSRDNPALIEASSQVKVQVWRSCTKAWREGEGVWDEWSSDWWAPHGDGARQVLVAWYPDNAYDLGERAETCASPCSAASASDLSTGASDDSGAER